MKKSILKTLNSLCSISILILTVFIFTRCKNDSVAYISKVHGNDVIVCPVDKVTDTIHIPLSSLLESCEMVKLQTIDDALFDRAFHTAISEKYICIKSYGQIPAKLFDINGQFLRNIGTIGRGPGEYSQLYGLQFNKEGKILYLLPFGTTRNILVYDVEGNHLKDIPLAYTQRKFKAFFSSDSIITIVSMPFKTDSAICFQQTYNGRLIQQISPPQDLISRNFDGEIFSNQSTSDFDFFNTASDTLFHYNTSKNILEPKSTISFGEGKKPIFTIKELPGYFYYWFYWLGDDKRKPGNILVDKNTLDAKYFDIKNDYYGNINAASNFSHGYFINIVAAITLKTQLEEAIENNELNDQMRQKLINLNNSLKPEDNDVVFFGKLK